jgi:hypothetical protein
MKVIGRHNWITGATITELSNENNTRRFIATIRGWRNWKIYEGQPFDEMGEAVRQVVLSIRDRIDRGDESVFNHSGYFIKSGGLK